MISDLLSDDRERSGLTVEQAARRLGIPVGRLPEARGRRAMADLGGVRSDRGGVRLAALVPMTERHRDSRVCEPRLR
jgi:hypothetical protein